MKRTAAKRVGISNSNYTAHKISLVSFTWVWLDGKGSLLCLSVLQELREGDRDTLTVHHHGVGCQRGGLEIAMF